MTDIWDEKPEPDHDWSNGIYRRSYYSQKRMDDWLEKLKTHFEEKYKLSYQQGVIHQISFMEVEIKELREKAEKWDKIQESPYLSHEDPEYIIGDAEFQFNLRTKLEKKPEAFKKWYIEYCDTKIEKFDHPWRKLEKILEGEG